MIKWPWRKDRAARPQAHIEPIAPVIIKSAPTSAIEPQKRRMVSDRALGTLSSKPPKPARAFEVAKPFPGVVPDTARDSVMAMDYDAAQNYAYAMTIGVVGEGLAFPGYQALAELAQRPEYRRMSEIVAKEMTRKWIRIHSTGGRDGEKGDVIGKLNDAMVRFNVPGLFSQAAEADGLFGRAQIYIDTGYSDDPDELATPLVVDPRKIKKGGLKRLALVEPIWTYPGSYNANNPLAADFYQPSTWYVQGKRVHRTRLLTFVSREVPDMLKPAYAFGGLSMTQMARPYVDMWLRARESVSDIMHSFSVSGIKTNLNALLEGGFGSDPGGGDELIRRADLYNKMRDNRGLFLLDKNSEEFFQVTTPLGTLDRLQAQAQEQMAAVSGIPLVKLLGITPSGLNASSDGEIRVFYDWIAAQQEHLFRRHLRTILNILQLNEFGVIDPEIDFAFEPLWQMGEDEKATIRKTNTDSAVALINAGILSAEEERHRLAGEDDGLYGTINPDDLPEPPEGNEDPFGSDPTGEDPEDGTAASVTPQEADKAPPPFAAAKDKDFEENKHPRAGNGQFGSGGGESSSSSEKPAAEKPKLREGMAAASNTVDGKRTMADGSPLPPHIESLKIPPAWTDVQVATDPKANLLVTGRDEKGRLQPKYSDAFMATNAAAKFERVSALAAQFPDIQKQNAEAQQSSDPKKKDAADCLDLIMKMGVRPGSEDDTGAKVKAYGATTLMGQHVVASDEGTHLRFTGKKGVAINLKVHDEALRTNLTERAEKAGPDGALFPNINEKALLDHTHTMGDGSFKTKDFRTHLGTKTAAEMIAAMPVPTDDKSYKAAVKKVAVEVSSRLGNTPIMALQSYINPTVFSAWGPRNDQ